MSICLFLILMVLCIGSTAYYLCRRGGIYEYPFLAVVTVGGFMVPQFYGIRHAELPDHALARSLIVVITCLCGLIAGFELGQRKRVAPGHLHGYDERKAIHAAAFLTVLGSVFFVKISRLPDDMLFGTWSGLPVAYRFFTFTLTYGLVMALILYLGGRNRLALFVAILGTVFLLDRIVMAGRRSTMVQLPLIILTCVWLSRRWQIPRAVFCAGAVTAFILLGCLVSYRAITTEGTGYASFLSGPKLPSLRELRQIDPLEQVKRTMDEGGPEVELLVHGIHAASVSASYDWGAYHWNGLVHNFVPAQLVGNTFKQSLMIGESTTAKLERIGYAKKAATAPTGFFDAFGSFWYCGWVKFFIIAYIMGHFYRDAMHGDYRSQVYYVCLQIPAVHAVPHSTQIFLSAMVMLALFTCPVFWLCQRKVREGVPLVAWGLNRNRILDARRCSPQA